MWTSIIKTPPLLLTILPHNEAFAQELNRVWPVCMKIVSNLDRIPLGGPLILIRGCLIDRAFRYFLNICKTRWPLAQVQQPRFDTTCHAKLCVPSVVLSTDRSSCIVAVAALGSRLFTQTRRVALACDTYLNVNPVGQAFILRSLLNRPGKAKPCNAMTYRANYRRTYMQG